MEYAVITIAIVLVASIIGNVVAIRRQEKLEDYIRELEESNTEFYNFFKELKTKMSESNSRIRAIDHRGSFEADDEIGFVFKEIRDIVELLNRSF